MSNVKHLLGAIVLTTMSALPALAQPVINDPGRCQAEFPNANCQNLGPGNPYTDGGQRADVRRGFNRSSRHWRESRADRWRGDNLVSPAEGVVANVTGAALGAAGGVATAPFRSGAWDNSWGGGWGNAGWDNSYGMYDGAPGGGMSNRAYVGTYTAGNVAGNWVACPRGTLVQGVDGRMHRCR